MSVKYIDKLALYDPNENIGGDQYSSYGFGNNPDSNNAVNQEDLIMYCNLRAFTRPRSYIMNSNSDNGKLQSVASARINFLKPNPEKNKFTTDWTELDASGRPNSDEMLGINSVQITYDTSYVPRVTITMTDVRGQALNEDPADSPYGAFFNFPYPMFVLEVKGYYGKAIKYLLHLLKYSSRFNYSTGNFEITCEFVGFTYALLSDLNVQYGLVASQMELNGKKGKDKLREKFILQKEKYKNIYPDIVGDIDKIIDSDLYTLVNLINKSKDLNTFVGSLSQSSELFNEKGALDNFVDLIQKLYDNINNTKSNDPITNSVFNQRVQIINNDSLFKNFKKYENELKCNIVAPTNNPLAVISEQIKNDYNTYYKSSFEIVSQNNNTIMKSVDDEVKSQLENFLGFTPTIRNIMLIICNNFELFLDLLTETTKDAATKRKNKLKNITITKRFDNKDLELVYPWPALYDTNFEICYFDDLPELNITDYPEKDFVESFLNATAYTNKLLAETGNTTVSTVITNEILYNPIHTQEYTNVKLPIFDENTNITELLYRIVEHGLLMSSNSWQADQFDAQVKKFGEMDADNLIKTLSSSKPNLLQALSNILNWKNDSTDNPQPKGIIQNIDNSSFKIQYFNILDPLANKIKDNFQYIKPYESNYLTDIVLTEGINNLTGKYPALNNLRFVPEIKNNLFDGNSSGYGAGSVSVNTNGFIYYEKNNKFTFPEDFTLASMFEPFMHKEGGNVVYNRTKINNDTLLTSLKGMLKELQSKVPSPGVKHVLSCIPGVTDDLKDFVLFNGIHKTKMVNALSYIFFNDNEYLDPNLPGDFRDPFYTEYKYYFPFTTINNPESFLNDEGKNRALYFQHLYRFLDVYQQLVENIVNVITNGLEKTNNYTNNRLYSDDIYQTGNANVNFGINKLGDFKVFRNNGQVGKSVIDNKESLKNVYELIKEFFNADIQMISKSNGLKDIYDAPLKYWTNYNNSGKQSWSDTLVNTKKITYNGKVYDAFTPAVAIDKYLRGFKTKIDAKIKEINNRDINSPEAGSKTTSVKTASDLKKSMYQTIKNINDKWIIDNNDAGINQYTWSLSGDVDVNGGGEIKTNNNREFLFDHFFFIDRVNRDIGSELLLDFRALKNYYDKVNSKNSLYSIIGELAKTNEMIFHPLTSYINFGGITTNSNNVASVDNLFKPTKTLDFESSTPSFIMQYVGKSASYQYENQNHLPDVVKIDFSGDNPRFINPPKSPFVNLDDTNTVNSPVAFFVDMGIKNQNMFRGISLDQAEFRETNESITVWDQLTSQKENRSIQTIGNNIYPILSRRSYTCKVESLGNMMIQPTMYFYLRYIPLFSGLYLITKVSHSIQPNNIVTNFEGVRMSSLNFPLVSQFISTLSKEILEKGSSGGSIISVKEDANFWNNLSNSTKADDISMKGRIVTFYNGIKDSIKNPAVQAAMICVAYKESGLKPKNEATKELANTNRFAFFNVFDNLKKYTTEGPNGRETSPFINELKKYPAAFYNLVYGTGEKGSDFENKPTTKNPINIPDGKGKTITVYDDENGDGYKYRGRGYNGITGRYGYKLAKKDTGVDVIQYPDDLNKVDVAAKAMLGYMRRGTKGNITQSTDSSNILYQVYSSGTSLENYDSANYQKAYNTIFLLNAGPGKSMQHYLVEPAVKDGYDNGYKILQSIYNAIKEGKIK
jgi:hypothetical protein